MQERQVTHRRRHLPAARPVHRPGHPEPHRAGGDLPAARGADRPLHAQGEGRLPDPRGGAGHHGPHGRWPRRRMPPGGRPGPARRGPRDRAPRLHGRPRCKDYIVNLVFATRDPRGHGLADLAPLIEYGASPRATLFLALAARAHAFLRRRGLRHARGRQGGGLRRAAPPGHRSPTRPRRRRSPPSEVVSGCSTGSRSRDHPFPSTRPSPARGSRREPWRQTVPWRRLCAGRTLPPATSCSGCAGLRSPPAARCRTRSPGSTTPSSRAGAWTSARSGAYAAGDEVRAIDWNVTARTGQLHVKRFVEERELTVMVLCDVSGSTDFGSGAADQGRGGRRDRRPARLQRGGQRRPGRAGALHRPDRAVRPAAQGAAARAAARSRRSSRPAPPRADLGLRRASSSCARPCGGAPSPSCSPTSWNPSRPPPPGGRPAGGPRPRSPRPFPFELPLRVAARKHDLVPVRLADRLERELPAAGLAWMEDPETGRGDRASTSRSRAVRERLRPRRAAEDDGAPQALRPAAPRPRRASAPTTPTTSPRCSPSSGPGRGGWRDGPPACGRDRAAAPPRPRRSAPAAFPRCARGLPAAARAARARRPRSPTPSPSASTRGRQGPRHAGRALRLLGRDPPRARRSATPSTASPCSPPSARRASAAGARS